MLRFPKSLHGSSVYANILSLEEAHSLKASIGEPVTTREELERIKYLGSLECNHKANPLKAYFEYHIEQGHILEESSQKIGIVHQSTAYRWLMLKIRGKESHTGATPYHRRSDSVLAGASMILVGTKISKKMNGMFSTGIFEAHPGSINTTAGYVEMSVDLRHESDDMLNKLEKEIIEASYDVAKDSNCEFVWERLIKGDAKIFNDQVVDSITRAAHDNVGESLCRTMKTWAGHDCCAVSSTGIPSAMIFCPSREGITHNPQEFTKAEDCAIGCQVLLHAVLDYDSNLI